MATTIIKKTAKRFANLRSKNIFPRIRSFASI